MTLQVNVRVEDDRSNAIIQFTNDGADAGSIVLAPPDLEELIEVLGKARAHLSDPVPEKLDGTWRKDFFVAANWHVQESPETGGKAVLVRHPGFGWLGFILQNEAARRLATALKS